MQTPQGSLEIKDIQMMFHAQDVLPVHVPVLHLYVEYCQDSTIKHYNVMEVHDAISTQ